MAAVGYSRVIRHSRRSFLGSALKHEEPVFAVAAVLNRSQRACSWLPQRQKCGGRASHDPHAHRNLLNWPISLLPAAHTWRPAADTPQEHRATGPRSATAPGLPARCPLPASLTAIGDPAPRARCCSGAARRLLRCGSQQRAVPLRAAERQHPLAAARGRQGPSSPSGADSSAGAAAASRPRAASGRERLRRRRQRLCPSSPLRSAPVRGRAPGEGARPRWSRQCRSRGESGRRRCGRVPATPAPVPAPARPSSGSC